MNCLLNEIYPCLMGESTAVGLAAALVRLNGCNLACTYCDTQHSRTEPGQLVPVTEVVELVVALRSGRVLLTGGEPMLQADATQALAGQFLSKGMTVYLETNGSVPLAGLPREVVKIVDVKTPGSGHGGSFLDTNLACLNPHDELKFVITSREDYDWSVRFLQFRRNLGIPRNQVLFSPCSPMLQPVKLAEWILEDRLDVRFHIQMHKFVWGDKRGV